MEAEETDAGCEAAFWLREPVPGGGLPTAGGMHSRPRGRAHQRLPDLLAVSGASLRVVTTGQARNCGEGTKHTLKSPRLSSPGSWKEPQPPS